MTQFRNIVFVAALAGLIAGVFVTILHSIGTVPIILKAETYETDGAAAETAAPAAATAEATTEHHHEADLYVYILQGTIRSQLGAPAVFFSVRL